MRTAISKWLLTRAIPGALLVMAIASQAAERQVPVNVDLGAPVVHFSDSVVEFEVVTYSLTLQQGQELGVLLASNNAANCFDLFAPGATKPVYVGGDSGNMLEYKAPETGQYLIKVFLLRLAARDGQTADYELELKFGPSSLEGNQGHAHPVAGGLKP